MSDQTRDLIVFAIIGIIAGFLASLIVGGGGLIRYLVTGVIGAFVGGYIFKALGVDLGIYSRSLNTNNPLPDVTATCCLPFTA